MHEHRKKVQTFFDRAAASYRKKRGSFTDHYFDQRLDLAITAAAPTANDHVLDIGCGTGVLYDRLRADRLANHYLGIDLSEKMLAASKIPTIQQDCLSFADFHHLTPPEVCFDLIFALGLTTYLPSSGIKSFHASVFDRLRPGGRAVISYTNAHSWDYRWRKLANRWAGQLLPSHRSLGRDFPIYATSPDKLGAQLPANKLQISTPIWLPAAWPLPGFLPPKLVLRPSGGPRWRGDFMLVFEKKAN